MVVPTILTPFIMKKARYRIKNWKEYNEALAQRGSLTVWIADDALHGWMHRGKSVRGRPCMFSDAAILCTLTLRAVFHLPLRQTEAFLRSVFQMMGSALPVPDYSTLCLRGRTLNVPLLHRTSGPLHLLLDSTGLKVCGEGEWKVKIHGQDRHRKWKKFHLALDAQNQDIVACLLTSSRTHDGNAAPRLLKAVEQPVLSVTGDGGYDRINAYHAIGKKNALPIIPPRKDAKIRRWRKDPADGKWKKHVSCMDPRDAIVRTIRKGGRRRWKRESGYHQRSLIETAMFRQKIILGPGLRSRRAARQETEILLRCRILNRMTALGMPESVKMS